MGSRSVEKGEKALTELQKCDLKGSLSLVQLDVTDKDSIEIAVKTIEESFGRIDTLINNAGISISGPSLIEQLRQTFETNTFGPAVVTEAFIPLLKKSTQGRLIYVSSGLGSIELRTDKSHKYYRLPAMAYRMSKAALNMLTVCHEMEFGEAGIKVFSFNPGYVVTNLTGEHDRENRIKQGAGSAEVSAQTLLSIVDGRRDADVGKFVYKDGVHPW